MTVKLNKDIAERIQQLQTPSTQQPKPSIITDTNIKVKQMIQEIQNKQIEHIQTPKDSLPVKPVAKHPTKTSSGLNNGQPVYSQVVLIRQIVRSSEISNQFLGIEKMAELLRQPKEELRLTKDLVDQFRDRTLTRSEKLELQEHMLTVMKCPKPILNIIVEYTAPTRTVELIQAVISVRREYYMEREDKRIKVRQVQEDMLAVMNCPISILKIVDEYSYSKTQFSENRNKVCAAMRNLFKPKTIRPKDISQLRKDMLSVMNCPRQILEIVDAYAYGHGRGLKVKKLQRNSIVDQEKFQDLILACNVAQNKFVFRR